MGRVGNRRGQAAEGPRSETRFPRAAPCSGPGAADSRGLLHLPSVGSDRSVCAFGNSTRTELIRKMVSKVKSEESFISSCVPAFPVQST